MQIYKSYFGKKLQEALQDAPLSQKDLADALDVQSSTVSRWVNGHDFPSDDKLPGIIEALGVKSEFFNPVPGKSAFSRAELRDAFEDAIKSLDKTPTFNHHGVEISLAEIGDKLLSLSRDDRESVLDLLLRHAETAAEILRGPGAPGERQEQKQDKK